jgi:glycine C-acetyltransferase
MLMLVLLMVFVYMGKRFTYRHNDLEWKKKNLERATKLAEVTGGGILLLLKVFWMRGQQGKLKEIAMKQKFNFRFS